MIHLSDAALAALAAAVAVELDTGGAPALLCARLERVLGAALRDDAFVALFDGRARSFEAWHDAQRGFVVHASIHQPGHRTPGHDHAEAWAVYGMYRGRTAYRLFERGADIAPGRARLSLLDERVAGPPSVATVLPGQVHENWNPGQDVAWNLVLRPRPLRDVWRRAFDVETGAYAPMRRASAASEPNIP